VLWDVPVGHGCGGTRSELGVRGVGGW
jgi:hypothetical protein